MSRYQIKKLKVTLHCNDRSTFYKPDVTHWTFCCRIVQFTYLGLVAADLSFKTNEPNTKKARANNKQKSQLIKLKWVRIESTTP